MVIRVRGKMTLCNSLLGFFCCSGCCNQDFKSIWIGPKDILTIINNYKQLNTRSILRLINLLVCCRFEFKCCIVLFWLNTEGPWQAIYIDISLCVDWHALLLVVLKSGLSNYAILQKIFFNTDGVQENYLLKRCFFLNSND